MSYAAVLFDMDGVIVDSEPLHTASTHAVLKNYGHTLTDEHYKQHFLGRTDEAGFQRYFEFVGENVHLPVVLDAKAKAYMKLSADQLISFPGVLDCIHDLKQRDVSLALVTGSLRAEVDVVLTSFDLTGVFDAILSAEDITKSKPDPEGYLKGAKALGIDPVDCIVVEDTPHGIAAAKAAGMRCIAVTNTHDQSELAGADLVVNLLKKGTIDRL
jgi:beta-phosphoglucomutase